MNEVEQTAIAAVRYHAASTGLLCCNRTFVAVEATGRDMAISLVHADQANCQCRASHTVSQLGINPLIRVIAEKIVTTVNMNAHIIPASNTDELQSEIERHYKLSLKVIDYIGKNPDKDTLKMATVFACAPQTKCPVILSIPEVKQAAASHARQYAVAISDFISQQGLRMLDIEKIILVGDTLGMQLVRDVLQTLGESRLAFYPSSARELFPTSDAMVSSPVPGDLDDESTQFQMADTPAPAAPLYTPQQPSAPEPAYIDQYKEVMSITIDTLQQGTLVRLDTFDPTPGKGAAFQEMEYLGDGLFKVVASGRSLQNGDIAKPYAASWAPGIQIDLEITRGPKPLGRFRTRLVKRIMMKNYYER